MKKISILGSTGSIGQSTLEVISRHPDKFQVVGLTARGNTRLLESQIIAYKPRAVAVFDESAASELKKKHLSVKISSGIEGLIEVAALDEADMVVSAITGSAGMLPTFAAINAGNDIALANKEALVMAGPLIMDAVSKMGVMLIPVDSEHSAIFQCLNGRRIEEVQKLMLTASGGPFIRLSASDLKTVTPEEALKHPNWPMGRKITIDSATLMNKGLEVIEAHYLFGIPAERIEVILHPQSIVHSMVEFIDGSILAQMSVPDMKGPICYALSYPQRLDKVLPPLNLLKVRELTFEKPDNEKFPCLSLAYKALKVGGTMPSVLNAANEVAVEAFLNKKISLKEIATVIADTMNSHNPEKCVSIKNVLEAAGWAKEKAKEIMEILN
ncbi:MAG: 1-deoxy-D-xylulose-5-phosphate reductoisomerase [Nitrospirae bacterium]|nr:1-deoxy-D-xylulose-5-phosphate reductoisomerase [Nitrospirota bacterium]